MKTEEERQVAASISEERETLRKKAADVAIPRMLCALKEEEEGVEEEVEAEEEEAD